MERSLKITTNGLQPEVLSEEKSDVTCPCRKMEESKKNMIESIRDLITFSERCKNREIKEKNDKFHLIAKIIISPKI